MKTGVIVCTSPEGFARVFPSSTSFHGCDLSVVNRLLDQISYVGPKLRFCELVRFFNGNGIIFFARHEEAVVGMATLFPQHDLNSYYGIVGNVVVNKKSCPQELTILLMRKLVAYAKTRGMSRLELRGA